MWISAGALVVSLGVMAGSFLRRSPLVPAGVAEELRREVADLRNKIAVLTSEISGLRTQLGLAMADREWWREEYRKLKAG